VGLTGSALLWGGGGRTNPTPENHKEYKMMSDESNKPVTAMELRRRKMLQRQKDKEKASSASSSSTAPSNKSLFSRVMSGATESGRKRANQRPSETKSVRHKANPQSADDAENPSSRGSEAGFFQQLSEFQVEETRMDVFLPSAQQSATSSGAEAHADERQWEACRVPLDWTLKTSATYEASFDLEWVHTFSAARRSRAVQRFVQQPPAAVRELELGVSLGSSGEGEAEATAAETAAAAAQDLWWSSLLWYQFPGGWSTPPPRNVLDGAAHELRKASVNQWREAFSSLYYAMRHGDIPYFYLKSAQFTILWRGDPADAADTPASAPAERWRYIRPFALVSSSTRDFRQKLREAQVEFTLPNNASSTVQTADQREEDNQRELKAMERSHPGVTRTKPTRTDDSDPDSLVCVEGHVDIGGLYEVILSMAERALTLGWGTTGGGLGGATGLGTAPPGVSRDTLALTSSSLSSSSSTTSLSSSSISATTGGVAESLHGGAHEAPRLLARAPFLHATLEALRIQFAGSVMAAHGDKSTVHQQLELSSGFLLPCAVQQQCESLALLGKARHYASQAHETGASPHFSARLSMDASTSELGKHPSWASSEGSRAIDEVSFSVEKDVAGAWRDKFELTAARTPMPKRRREASA